MRDILNDIRERLAALDARQADAMATYADAATKLRQDHEDAVFAMDDERKALTTMLKAEVARLGGDVDAGQAAVARARLPLIEFVVTKLHAKGPLDKEAIRAEADVAGYPEARNGRTFNITLVNGLRYGKLIQQPNGAYAYPAKSPAESLFGLVEADEGGSPLMQ